MRAMHPAHRPPLARILVVEDEARLRQLLRLYLERAGYEVSEAEDGRAALEAFDEDPPDLLVVDLMLPRLQGEALIRAIREDSQVPILIASAKRSDVERIAGLRLGADDYLPKPFNVHELVERVNAILRRTGRAVGAGAAGSALARAGSDVVTRLSFAGGRLTYEPATRAYVCNGQSGRLTPAEARLMMALVHGGRVPLDREQLLRAVAGPHAETSRNVDVHVGNLRRKLGDDPASPWAIETIPEVGYRWLAPADPPAVGPGDGGAGRDASVGVAGAAGGAGARGPDMASGTGGARPSAGTRLGRA
jgi:DNA-binding response OmpR family regulator